MAGALEEQTAHSTARKQEAERTYRKKLESHDSFQGYLFNNPRTCYMVFFLDTHSTPFIAFLWE